MQDLAGKTCDLLKYQELIKLKSTNNHTRFDWNVCYNIHRAESW